MHCALQPHLVYQELIPSLPHQPRLAEFDKGIESLPQTLIFNF